MQLIDGKKIAEKIIAAVKKIITAHSLTPGLAAILVGTDPSSLLYVAIKERACRKVGIYFEKWTFVEDASEDVIVKKINELNGRADIHAILVQLPLPSHLHEDKIIAAINPKKDADGFHPKNISDYLDGRSENFPVLIRVVDEILNSAAVKQPAMAVVLANSKIFADPVAFFLKQKGYAVTAYAPTPKKIPEKTKRADILISALGRPHFITASQVKNGATIIDVGTTRNKKGELCGDVDAESVRALSGYLTPVPGGVGPVTVACVLENVTRLSLYFKK